MDKEILWYKVAQSGTKWHKVAQTAGWRGGQRPGRGGLCSIPVGCVMISKNLFFFSFFLSFLFVFKLSLEIFLSNFNQTEIRNGIGTSRCVVHLIWLTYDFIIIIICIFFCFFFWKWVFSFLSFYKIHVGFRFREWKIWG